MSESFSWNFLGSSGDTNPGDPLPSGIAIERFALSYILMPYTNYPKRAITTVNLHPDSWNSFMFPYGGLRVEEADAAKESSTFVQLSDVLHGLIASNLSKYLAKAREELLDYYSELPDLKELAPVYRNYSLKFSKSANKWTSYIFTYHTCPLAFLEASGLDRSEIPMTDAAVTSATDTRQVNGVALEENVVAFLKSDIVTFWSGTDV